MFRLIPVLALISFAVFCREPVHAPHAMIVTQDEYATRAGIDVLKAGGNAVDAAVAIAFALAVTYPNAGNLGGGGFMLVRMADGATAFLDFREAAPRAAAPDMYLDSDGKPTDESLVGIRASGVPGTVRGLEFAHQKFGHKAWRELVDPSVRLARDGFVVSYATARSLRTSSRLPLFPDSKRIFLRDGNLYAYGETLRQPELARTLERIAANGAKDFYEGETARQFAAFEGAKGGLITLEDLKSYKVIERAPLRGRYKEFDVITAPPPSAGGFTMLQILAMLDGTGYENGGAGSASAIHFAAEAMRRAYADRSRYAADPDFVKVPLAQLLDPAYLAARRASINRSHASTSEQIGPGEFSNPESTETTHFNVVDAQGNVTAMTYTLNGAYGSGVTVPGLGFLLNNEMDDFAAKPGAMNVYHYVQGAANAIAPGKRPVSSMIPTIVLRGGRPYMLLGAPGGVHIPSHVTEVLLNVLAFKMGLQDAIDAPRFHHQWQPDELAVERGISPDTVALLRSFGHKVVADPPGDSARVNAIVIEPGDLRGAWDGRGSGAAIGY